MLDRNGAAALEVIYFAILHQKRIQRAHLYQYAEGWIPSTFQLKVNLITTDDDRSYPAVTVIEVLCSF
ncbi:hypothetical protein ARMSODRAFT_961049 [Armillaria solidipes]|uniref:Uncharacterized protein n=1 Tax=Armillaria solidipes TaxID=1076256 RepID=A0A2H3B9Y1_9AGAR|nr:hypothetical protein ARMSODRAFT_961049 [Armillaria solidipes]